ncbi:phenylacetate--CoA ligase [candidate division BRC1 bacterium HGW-BRC1-1]|jgi:phenylacetate-CoA ligase|nr:MAG: phenylacetate--CoA ligase [candidate division BRC1 bacterium HGW-BRC1-1]
MALVELVNNVFDPAELMPREELTALQLERLRDTMGRLAEVPFYKYAFTRGRITPDDIKSLDDVRRLPFTTKDDMRHNYPLGLAAVPRSEMARIHGSSGTTGKPTFVGYTHKDLDTWAGLCARFLVAGGLRPDHMVQVAFGYGLFTGGFGLHYGIEKVGAAIIPAAAGGTLRQIMLINDLKPDVIICTPSYALNIAEVARAEGYMPEDLSLKYGHFGGEPWTEDMRQAIERDLDIHAFNNYGLSEIIGPGVSGECMYHNGMHFQEDHFIVECIDPDTLEPMPDGERGELVLTSLTKEAMPILRYRTRDLATVDHSPCPCGRTGARMSRVVGRTDDMLIVRGANIFPSQIEEALLRIEGTAPQYVIEVNRPGALDEMTVRVEIRPQDFSDKMSQMQALRDRIATVLHSATGISINVELIEPQTLERSIGKAKRVIDNRDKTS